MCRSWVALVFAASCFHRRLWVFCVTRKIFVSHFWACPICKFQTFSLQVSNLRLACVKVSPGDSKLCLANCSVCCWSARGPCGVVFGLVGVGVGGWGWGVSLGGAGSAVLSRYGFVSGPFWLELLFRPSASPGSSFVGWLVWGCFRVLRRLVSPVFRARFLVPQLILTNKVLVLTSVSPPVPKFGLAECPQDSVFRIFLKV